MRVDQRIGADLRLRVGVFWEDITARRSISVSEFDGKSDAGRELRMASCVAIGKRKPHLDWGGCIRSSAGQPVEAALLMNGQASAGVPCPHMGICVSRGPDSWDLKAARPRRVAVSSA
jgi:hypothetical protein